MKLKLDAIIEPIEDGGFESNAFVGITVIRGEMQGGHDIARFRCDGVNDGFRLRSEAVVRSNHENRLKRETGGQSDSNLSGCAPSWRWKD